PPSSPPWGYGQPTEPQQPYPYGPGGPAQGGTNPYGAPGAPSTPLYGTPGAPSAPLYGTPGEPAPPWQPWQPAPGQTVPGWGPPSQGYPGGMPPMMAPPAPPRKSRRGLWIALSVIAAVVIVGGGAAAYAFVQIAAPAASALVFCGDLKTQSYAAAYSDLSSDLRTQISSDEFVHGNQTIDLVEGTVTACAQASGSNAYQYSFGANTAKLAVVLSRATAGNLAGTVSLKKESSGWKVSGLDTSLLGINLGALQTAGAFCAALQTQNYSAAYALLTGAQQQQLTQQLFAAGLQLHDQIDGKVSGCTLNSFTVSGSDTNASLTVSITRTTLGAQQGAVTLQVENNAWKVSNVADSLSGTDLGPLGVGSQFCADLVSSNFSDAYSLLSADYASFFGSEAKFTAIFTEPSPYKWAGCTPDFSTYKVSGSTASYVGTFTELNTSTSVTIATKINLQFVKQGGVWKLDDLPKAS
ncbi:MAG TPA: hypothetical protein VF916_05050, partial [Ktedonobacterales bacterium]